MLSSVKLDTLEKHKRLKCVCIPFVHIGTPDLLVMLFKQLLLLQAKCMTNDMV